MPHQYRHLQHLQPLRARLRNRFGHLDMPYHLQHLMHRRRRGSLRRNLSNIEWRMTMPWRTTATVVVRGLDMPLTPYQLAQPSPVPTGATLRLYFHGPGTDAFFAVFDGHTVEHLLDTIQALAARALSSSYGRMVVRRGFEMFFEGVSRVRNSPNMWHINTGS
jgi:hypothetical protein